MCVCVPGSCKWFAIVLHKRTHTQRQISAILPCKQQTLSLTHTHIHANCICTFLIILSQPLSLSPLSTLHPLSACTTHWTFAQRARVHTRSEHLIGCGCQSTRIVNARVRSPHSRHRVRSCSLGVQHVGKTHTHTHARIGAKQSSWLHFSMGIGIGRGNSRTPAHSLSLAVVTHSAARSLSRLGA